MKGPINLKKQIDEACKRYSQHGSFVLLPGEIIDEVVVRHNVAIGHGIYAIFAGLTRDDELIYVGKAGTFRGPNNWSEQGLRKRMCMKQDGIYRKIFFRNHIETQRLPGLTFWWFLTYSDDVRVLPALAELQLLQACHDEHGRLPALNKEV